MRNPAWNRDEVILGLDVYLRNIRIRPITAANPDVLFLSRVLNELPFHPSRNRGEQFRNPAGVDIQIRSFQKIDPEHTPETALNCGELFREIWNEFASQKDYLNRVAAAILACHPLPFEYRRTPDLEEISFLEGSILYQYHRYLESDVERLKCLMKEVSCNGWLSCSVCGFDFERAYGKTGEGFIEFHCFCPPTEYGNAMKVLNQEFGPVCCNCHRMLHRRRPWLVKADRVLLIEG